MKVWAHRGFSHIYPENTMLAFEKAYEEGADGIETDVHLTKDGKVVIIHDENLLRTCGIDRSVSECTLSFLSKTKASRTKNDAFDATIP
ncbi:MAG: glycerophosphodiester phosphodiesterase, partial [Candidatus Ornithospirochaeta sp.]